MIGHRGGVICVDLPTSTPHELAKRCIPGTDNRTPRCHGFYHWKAETFAQAGEEQR
jgi:hypothetical protein